jgi:ATP-binding cassette subfamily B (MDR/TAP) protein 1
MPVRCPSLTLSSVAFTQEWRLALAMSSILIPITAAGATMQKFMIKHQTSSLGAIAKAGTIAEEVISSIRTAQAFGAQKPLAYLFDTHIAKAVKVGSNGANVHALGLAAMFFVIYSGYALAFFFGGRLVSRSAVVLGMCSSPADQSKWYRTGQGHHRLLVDPHW